MLEVKSKKANPFYSEELMEMRTCRAVYLDKDTGEEIYMCHFESDEFTQKVDKELIKADIPNSTIMTIYKNKELTFKATEVISRRSLQLRKLQTTLQHGEVEAWHMPDVYEVQKDDKGLYIDIPYEPLQEVELNILSVDDDTRMSYDSYTYEEVKGKKTRIRFKEDNDIAVWKKTVRVSTYQYLKECDYADLAEDTIPTVGSLIVWKPYNNTDDKVVMYKQYFFPKVSMDCNITESGTTEKGKQTEDTEFTVEKDKRFKYIGRIMFIPVEDDIEDEEPTTPPTPVDSPEISDLSATEDAGDVDLTWSLPVTGTLTALKLQYRTESGSFADVNTDGTTGVNIPTPLSTSDTSVTVTGLTPSTKYYFRLVMNGDTSLISNTANVTLA